MSWLTLLKHVPWTDVISNAPKVVDSAKKLWDSTVGQRDNTQTPAPTTPSAENPLSTAGPVLSTELQAIQALQSRTETLEQAAQTLREQLQAASQVARELAEQNTQLITRLQTQDERLRQLTHGLLLVGLLALSALAWLAWGR